MRAIIHGGIPSKKPSLACPFSGAQKKLATNGVGFLLELLRWNLV
jgi:hypothetical protein